ncbi:MAG: hypothetical protein ABIZ49_08710 [Opitutaceae bacterium]
MNSLRPFFSRALIAATFLGTAAATLAVENLDRGMVALRTSDSSVYLGWRLLGVDPAGRVFNIYRSTGGGAAAKLNDAPIVAGTNFVDTTAKLDQPNSWLIKGVTLPRGGDPLYRKDVAHQTMGYFYPPQLSYPFK